MISRAAFAKRALYLRHKRTKNCDVRRRKGTVFSKLWVLLTFCVNSKRKKKTIVWLIMYITVVLIKEWVIHGLGYARVFLLILFSHFLFLQLLLS